VPPKRKLKPLSPEHAALAQAIELLIAEDPQLSQDSAAVESGLNIRQVNAFARGQGNPTFTTLLRLCKGLHVGLGELMTLTDEMRGGSTRDEAVPVVTGRALYALYSVTFAYRHPLPWGAMHAHERRLWASFAADVVEHLRRPGGMR